MWATRCRQALVVIAKHQLIHEDSKTCFVRFAWPSSLCASLPWRSCLWLAEAVPAILEQEIILRLTPIILPLSQDHRGAQEEAAGRVPAGAVHREVHPAAAHLLQPAVNLYMSATQTSCRSMDSRSIVKEIYLRYPARPSRCRGRDSLSNLPAVLWLSSDSSKIPISPQAAAGSLDSRSIPQRVAFRR